MNILKFFAKITLFCFIAFGILFGIGDVLLQGNEHFNFFGYQISENFYNDDDSLSHIGDAIIIKKANEYELHHDVPIAYCDQTDNRIYVYRIISHQSDDYVVCDNYGTKINIKFKDILGRVVSF